MRTGIYAPRKILPQMRNEADRIDNTAFCLRMENNTDEMQKMWRNTQRRSKILYEMRDKGGKYAAGEHP